MKKTIIAVIVLGLIAIVVVIFMTRSPEAIEGAPNQNEAGTPAPGGSSTAPAVKDTTKTVIGASAGKRDIIAYHFNSTKTASTTPKEILFVGGIHGGYEWNTALVAFELMDYLKANPEVVPAGVKVTVIPVLNPDGLQKTVGTTTRFSASDVPKTESIQVAGRFNANTVDLNRNFDCDWQAEGTWQEKTVSGGTSAFSEPEAKAIRDYVTTEKPTAVIVWYSAAGGVFASNCHNGVSSETLALTKAYAKASGYPPFEEFNFYEITGDMTNWLAKINVPAISILLTTHTSTEWEKNLKGIKAVLERYKE